MKKWSDEMSGEAGSNGRTKEWTPVEVLRLRKLAREGTAQAAAEVLGRTVSSVRAKALKAGISFRPVQPASMKAQR